MDNENNINYNFENQNDDGLSDKGKDSENQKSEKIGKRRAKNEKEGRTFKCEYCSKSYLSYPALYTHCKNKHNISNTSGRERGRPKRQKLDSEIEKNKFNPTNISYFSKEGRTGKTEINEIENCINTAFNELYSEEYKNRNEQRLMKSYSSIEQHPFLNKYKNDDHGINKKEDEDYTDKVFIYYLNKMSEFCNPNYFTKLIKFVTLFREHVNLIMADHNIINENNQEYTEINKAEDVPDCSNEFITEFLDPDSKNQDFGFSKNESIDLTQNLCFWMYDNNFTSSKLSLIH